jgi:hypothetical protein
VSDLGYDQAGAGENSGRSRSPYCTLSYPNIAWFDLDTARHAKCAR